MKLSELFKKAGEPRLSRDFKSLAELNKSDDDLKAQIEGGKIPSIQNAGYSIHGYAWGDLEKLGFAHKEQEPAGGGLVSERWAYTGPNPIKLLTKHAKLSNGKTTHETKEVIMKKGDATDWVEIDYT